MFTRHVVACLVVCLVVVTSLLNAVAGAPTDPWLIAADTTWSDETIHLEEDLVVASGATLTLDRVTLVVEQGGTLLVAAGGTLHLDESALLRGATAPAWPFDVQGVLVMKDSVLSGSHGIVMRGPGTAGSVIRDSVLQDTADQAVRLTLRASVEVTDSLFQHNGWSGSSTPGGIYAADATVGVRDSIFLGNAGYAVSVVSTTAGAKLLGPAMSTIEGNIFAHGSGGVHVQEGEDAFNQIHGNLFTNLSRGLNLQGPAGVTLGENSLVGNRVAAANFGHTGTTSILNDHLDHHIDLGDSWLGPDGPVTEGVNRIHGPFATDRLAAEDPVPHLSLRLEVVEDDKGLKG